MEEGQNMESGHKISEGVIDQGMKDEVKEASETMTARIIIAAEKSALPTNFWPANRIVSIDCQHRLGSGYLQFTQFSPQD